MISGRAVVVGLALVVAGAIAGAAAERGRQAAVRGRRITLTVREATVALEGLDDAIAFRGVDLAELPERAERIVAAQQSAAYAGLSAVIESRLRALNNVRSYTDDELRDDSRGRPE